MFYFQSQKNQPFTNISTNLLVITKYLCARCRYASYIAIAISLYDVHAIYAHYSFRLMLLYLSITCERNEEKCRVINGNLLIKYPVIIIKVLSIWCLLLCIELEIMRNATGSSGCTCLCFCLYLMENQ